MAYTLREGLHFVYGIIGQVGSTALLDPNSFKMYANSGLNLIYNYKGYIWTWQHYKDVFTLSSEDDTEFKLYTSHPIRQADRFFQFNRQDVHNPIQPQSTGIESCPKEYENLPGVVCYDAYPETNIPVGKPIDLFQVLPHNQLKANQFAIEGGTVKGMGGFDQRIVHVKLEKPVKSLWFTYYRGPKHMHSFDEIIPLPDSFMTAWARYVAALIIPLYGIMAEQQELSFASQARKELDNLKMADNMWADSLQFDPNYPVQSKGNYF